MLKDNEGNTLTEKELDELFTESVEHTAGLHNITSASDIAASLGRVMGALTAREVHVAVTAKPHPPTSGGTVSSLFVCTRRPGVPVYITSTPGWKR